MVSPATRKVATLAVIVAALGYFVDIYDLILFGMVRKSSLLELGVCGDLDAKAKACLGLLQDRGIYLINMQMGGMLVGGILWGMLGDKRGRLSVMFGSITLYSIANIANGMVHSVDSYAVWRLIAGIGLAGELGAGITLVSELMGAERRGIGTTIVAALGVSGGLAAGVIGGAFPGVAHPTWRVAYYIGGGLGIALLVLRIGVAESGMFHATVANKDIERGNFFALFTDRKRLVRYLAIILVGLPIWYVIGVPFTFADSIGRGLGLDPAPNPATALFFCYGGCTIGGLGSGLLSQYLRSRKKALGAFLALTALSLVLYFTIGGTSLDVFYAICLFGGAASGYWAVFVTTAAELFGTNLRATVTTTVPNFVRGAVPLLTMSFKGLQASMSIVSSAIVVGAGTLILAVLGLSRLKETFGVDLDYHE
ncbi:MAG: MFS transporter [Deltaproteobacteria bacterium]